MLASSISCGKPMFMLAGDEEVTNKHLYVSGGEMKWTVDIISVFLSCSQFESYS